MRQAEVDPAQAKQDIESLEELYKERNTHFAGFLYSTQQIKTFDHTPEEREEHFEKLWNLGGFRILANNYMDMLSDETANEEAYNFWVKKTRARISEPEKRDILAPLEAPHVFGGKRISLEQDFYEQMDKPHVDVINIRQNPVEKVVPEGIITADGRLRKFDIIAIATGFDSITGGLKDINPTGLNDIRLAEKWKMGTYTYLGMSVADMPNMFFLYGPQAPTAYANGPSITEPQGEWVVEVMKRMRDRDLRRINPKKDAEQAWRENVLTLHKRTLRDKVDGWYNGTNIPGKPREALNYAGGIPLYLETIRGAVERDFEGFDVR